THALREDSGGAGQYRGGDGVALGYKCLVPCQVNINFERTKNPPWGLHGGANGQSNYAIIRRADGSPDEKVLKGTQIPLRPGDIVTFYTAGGGGYGDPGKRAREAILSDLAEGLISRETARRDYAFVSSRVPIDGRFRPLITRGSKICAVVWRRRMSTGCFFTVIIGTRTSCVMRATSASSKGRGSRSSNATAALPCCSTIPRRPNGHAPKH